ncbi:MAG: hypothetical protein GXY76_15925 [Chloroflexi bacterium]|nr:hypothetical protein [Chloroflexota bacterium]
MKIAVGSLGTNLDAWVGGKFGYCPQFIIVDSDTMDYVVVPMPPAESEQEASLKAIRTVARNGAAVLIVQKAMPACCQVMTSLGIEVVDGVDGLTVRQAVERYLRQQLAAPESRKGAPPKIAVAALGPDLGAWVGNRFDGACYFVVVDPATMSHEALEVEPVQAGQHLRLDTIRKLVEHGVNVVATTAITPPCCQALWSLAIDVVIVKGGATVAQVVEQFKRGELGEPQAMWPGEESR